MAAQHREPVRVAVDVTAFVEGLRSARAAAEALRVALDDVDEARRHVTVVRYGPDPDTETPDPDTGAPPHEQEPR